MITSFRDPRVQGHTRQRREESSSSFAMTQEYRPKPSLSPTTSYIPRRLELLPNPPTWSVHIMPSGMGTAQTTSHSIHPTINTTGQSTPVVSADASGFRSLSPASPNDRNDVTPSQSRLESPPRLLRPFRLLPLPPQVEGVESVELNPLLRFTGIGQPFPLDLSRSLSDSLRLDIDAAFLLQLATIPSLPSLCIVSHLLPNPIVVHRTSSNSAGVLVGDVMGVLCEAVSAYLNSDAGSEWIDPSSAFVRSNGRRVRSDVARGMIDMVEGDGHRRGDRRRLALLREKHHFMGLSRSTIGSETFELHVY